MDLVRSTNTATNTEFKELRKTLAKDVKGVEKQLRDLKGAVDMVENNRAKFPQITNPELGQRKLFIDDSTYTIGDIKKAMESQVVRQKMQKDENEARIASQKTSAMSTSTSSKADNSSFIRNQRQQQHQIIEQQDVMLGDLGSAVDRLGDMGRGINEELKEQNTMLGQMDEDLDEAGEKMNFVMARLAKLLKTKDGCQLWTIIILCLILALLVALVIWT